LVLGDPTEEADAMKADPFPGQNSRGTRRATVIALAAALALLCAGAPAARADFFKLVGRYQCLATPDAVCGDAAPSGPGPFPPAPPAAAPPETAEDAAPVPAAPVIADHAANHAGTADTHPAAARRPAHPAAPVDPLAALAARLQAGKPAPGDIADLRARAKAGEPRALEMLAWCEMAGIGTLRDPVHAYLLYGEAAKAGATDARATQRFIFRSRLTQDQRQQVLEIENGRFTAASSP
jgi:hypothetical protein